MTVAQMRAAVHDAYPGKPWQNKVNNMSDIQVQAIYFSLSERGAFNKEKPAPTPNKPKAESGTFEPFIGEQISFF